MSNDKYLNPRTQSEDSDRLPRQEMWLAMTFNIQAVIANFSEAIQIANYSCKVIDDKERYFFPLTFY